MTCEHLEDTKFVEVAAKLIVVTENAVALREELIASHAVALREGLTPSPIQVGLPKVMELMKELEPLQSHLLSEARERHLHDELVEALAKARKAARRVD